MATPERETTRHRSPAYPAFSLKVAIEKAILLYEAHRRMAVEPDTVKRSMGYEVTTSHSMRAISALIQFGLIEEDGNAAARKLKLSELGLNIVLRKETDLERVGLLRKAAAKPSIYKQMLDMWRDDLPTDDAISNFLLFTKNFNPVVVPGVLRDFKATYQFARLSWYGERPALSPHKEEATALTSEGAGDVAAAGRTEAQRDSALVQGDAPARDMRRYQLPLPRGRMAAIEVPTDATGDDMEFVVRYLALMKEALTAELQAKTGIEEMAVGPMRGVIPPVGIEPTANRLEGGCSIL